MAKEQTEIKERTNFMTCEPKRFHVIMHNDDFTTMEFVVKVLVTVFHKSQAAAEQAMMAIHKEGSAIVGTYSHDIALTKTEAVKNMAKEEGFPLQLSIRPE